jgi:CDP-4-dehydro-6-deoxyglucose reductase
VPTVTVVPDSTSVHAGEGEYVLAALNRSGYGFRTGCRRGGCGVCKADLLSGDVTYPVTVAQSVLSDDERSAGSCLTCRAVPAGDVVIRLRNDKLRCTSSLLAALAARDNAS